VVRDSWGSLPSAEEIKQVNALLEKLKACKRDVGVNGVGVVRNFLGRRVQPIKEWIHPAYEYTGLKDLTWESAKKWKARTLNARVAALFQKA